MNNYIYTNALDDMKTLKGILNNTISIKDVDINTKKRLIILCNNREQQIRKKISEYKNKLYKKPFSIN